MQLFATLHRTLPLLIVVAHTQCVLTHGEELRWLVAVSADVEAPMNEPPQCGNESSCFCKGATLAAMAAVSAPDESAPLTGVTASFTASHEGGALFSNLFEQIWKLDRAEGNAARALLQSFQI